MSKIRRWAVTLGASIANEFMNRRRWIAVVVFWILFVASIGLDPLLSMAACRVDRPGDRVVGRWFDLLRG